MVRLGILGLINFDDWDNPDYKEAGGINSVIKSILPYIKTSKIFLYGITYHKENLFREIIISPTLSIYGVIYMSPDTSLPRRIAAIVNGWRLKKIFREHGINAVYNHSEELGFWLPGTRVPYIQHLHTFVNALEVSGGRLARIKLFRHLWGKLRTRVVCRAYKTIAVNKDVYNMLIPLIGKERIIEFPNYVDANKFVPRDTTELRSKLNIGNSRVLLFTGRISAVKGMELFVDSLQELLKLDGNWIGIIVGGGEYEKQVASYIADKGLQDKFLLPGSVNDQNTLNQYYSLADVFAITSVSESVPLTLLESLVCGTPVVATDVGIARNVLGRNNGEVVGQRDPVLFAHSVQASVRYKTGSSLLHDSYHYSTNYASDLLNSEWPKMVSR